MTLVTFETQKIKNIFLHKATEYKSNNFGESDVNLIYRQFFSSRPTQITISVQVYLSFRKSKCCCLMTLTFNDLSQVQLFDNNLKRNTLFKKQTG